MNKIYNFLRYIYQVYILKARFSNKEKNKFALFGNNSEIELPCHLVNNQHLISIGNNTTILQGSRMQLYPELVNNIPHIKIGSNCYISFNVTLLAGADIIIGDRVLFASNILVTTENHGMDPENIVPYMHQKLECEPVYIGDGTWLGEKVCVMPGVTIGKKCIIGALSVVTKPIPDYCIAAGTPAKVIKKYNFKYHQWVKVTENGEK